MLNLKGTKVLVTGGHGFLGSYVREEFVRHGAAVCAPSHKGYDLCKRNVVERLYEYTEPDMVVHLAASVGGIEANAANPGKYFYDNIIMGAEVMDCAKKYGIRKYIQVGTSCSYPAVAPVPVKESDLWTGPVNEVTGPYGIAKLALITMAQGYRKQYGLNAVSVIPVNLYGPRDTFDPAKSHVIPALILKCLEAKKNSKPLVVWGTGNATREFLYVAEAAEAIRMAAEHYDGDAPVNIGTGKEVFIKDLAKIIADAVGFTGEIMFDNRKPDGQMRRCFDVSRAKEEFGFESKMPLEVGIKNTLEYYLNEQSPNSDS